MYSHTKIAIYDESEVMITNFSKYLYHKVNGKALMQYIGEKYGLEMDLIQEIDWYTIGIVLQSYSLFCQKKIVQIMYDWTMMEHRN